MIRTREDAGQEYLPVANWEDGISCFDRGFDEAVQEIERTYREQAVLYSLVEQMEAEGDADRICQIAVRELQEALSASTVILLLSDDVTDELSARASSGLYAGRSAWIRASSKTGVTGRALRARRALAVHCEKDDDVEGLPFPARHLLCLPMLFAEKTIGAIWICDKRSGEEFYAPEIKLAAALSAYVGFALSNTMLLAKGKEQEAALSQADRMLKQSFENLLQADKMATLGLMVGIAIHDVHNFLAAITGNAQLLEMSDADPRREAYCKNILFAAERIREVLQNIRDYSRKGPHAQARVEVRKPLEDAVALIERHLSVRKILLNRDFRTDISPIMGNANQLSQVFLNLIQNAVHAMEGGGTLTLSLDAVDNEVVVSVSDTGCGIQEEHMGRIFDLFFTTKPIGQGTGLGLAICKQIVEQHKGAIGVESTVGKGSRFTVRLPVANGSAPEADCPPSSAGLQHLIAAAGMSS